MTRARAGEECCFARRLLRKRPGTRCSRNGGTEAAILRLIDDVNPQEALSDRGSATVVPRPIDAPVGGAVCATASANCRSDAGVTRDACSSSGVVVRGAIARHGGRLPVVRGCQRRRPCADGAQRGTSIQAIPKAHRAIRPAATGSSWHGSTTPVSFWAKCRWCSSPAPSAQCQAADEPQYESAASRQDASDRVPVRSAPTLGEVWQR